MTGVIAVILVFGGLVFFHELGHFLVARAFGIGVKTFSLGFGPALFAHTKGKTRYQLALIPLGGFCALVGEESEADIPDPFTQAESFALRPAWQRFLVAAAGSAANLLLAWVICWGLLTVNGQQELLPQIGGVLEHSPAAGGGIKPGDMLLSINGKPLERWQQVPERIQTAGGTAVTIVVKRDDGEHTLTMTPKRHEQKTVFGETVETWAIGITPSGASRTVPLAFTEAATQSVREAWGMVHITWKILTGLVSRALPMDNMGGPIGIAQVIYQQAGHGLADVLFLAALISVNLGILNLLPIPVLDGGHLLFLLFEMVFRRPVPRIIQEKAMVAGLALLLMLMLFATYNDIMRIAVGPK